MTRLDGSAVPQPLFTSTMRLLLPVLFALLASASVGQTTSPRFEFQGLSWGATEGQITARYGERLRRAECSEALSRATAERLLEICESPVVAAYEVAGIPFELRFSLSSKNRRLSSISLYSSVEADPATGQAPDANWRLQYGRLVAALSERYGNPEQASVQSLERITRAVNRWRATGTLITLESMYVRAGNTQPAREEHQVLYRQIELSERGKL